MDQGQESRELEELEAAEVLPLVNRNALTVEPTEAYLEWAKSAPEPMPELTMQELCEERTVYLIPEVEEELEEWLKKNYRRIFEEELESWCTDESQWPEDLSLGKFKEFFKISYSSLVFDLNEETLEIE
jgi:hypothetical protein